MIWRCILLTVLTVVNAAYLCANPNFLSFIAVIACAGALMYTWEIRKK